MGFLDSLKKMLMGDNKTTTDQPSTNLDTSITPETPEVTSPEVSTDTSSDSESNS